MAAERIVRHARDAAPDIISPSRTPTVLHIGCNRKDKSFLPETLQSYREIRLDIDPRVDPDVLADMRDLSQLEDNSVDAIFSSHNIEHIFIHEVVPTLTGWHRVLRPGGFLDLRCPDIELACRMLLEKGALENLYTSPAGPVTAIDIIYGLTNSIRRGNTFMAHNCGFTEDVLSACLKRAGFRRGKIDRNAARYELRALVYK